MSKTHIFHQIEDATTWIMSDLGKAMSIAMPLGLGKPNLLVNSIYRRVKQDNLHELKIFTALSLEIPKAGSDLEGRFLEPFKKRHFGENYPELEYTLDLRKGNLPKNIGVYEFYFQAGRALSHFDLQKNYISLNYTHVAQEVYAREIQMLICIVAKNPKTGATYSLSCNPDLTLDLADLYKKNGKHLKIVGVVHPDLPFMTGDAEVPLAFFDAIVESPEEVTYPLFALPKSPVNDADFLVGLQASLLVEDGGTIQVGIGSLSDSLIYCLCLRHQHNEIYRKITDQLIRERFPKSKASFHQGPFELGLYGNSEMVMDAFMHLRKAGILKRDVFDGDRKIPHYMLGAFFLGSKDFYQWMRDRFQENDQGLCMTRVSKVNDLYDPHETAIRRQRVKARFFNMCMKMTLLGEAASDTLPSGQVVSGVGGQFNFVAMSHELPDSHSVILSKSFHKKREKKVSNVVWGHPHLTIPRHMRDVFITEYGIAFTRGQTDESVIRSMIEIADSEFQKELVHTAVKNKKIAKDYQVPTIASRNEPARVSQFLEPYKKAGHFKAFPFGSDFTPVEERLVFALAKLQATSYHPLQIPGVLWKGIRTSTQKFEAELLRMNLKETRSIKEWFEQKLLLGVLG